MLNYNVITNKEKQLEIIKRNKEERMKVRNKLPNIKLYHPKRKLFDLNHSDIQDIDLTQNIDDILYLNQGKKQ